MQKIFKEDISDEEALQNFLLDIDCLNTLLPWTGHFNMFDVLELSKQEKFHSKMLSWLLDSKESHGLGVSFFEGMINLLMEHAGSDRYDMSRMKAMDYSSFVIYKNWENIDVLMVSDVEKTVIAMVNKVDSAERDQQLGRLRKQIEKDFSEYDKVCIFLSKEGFLISDIESWDTMTYGDVVHVLNLICKDKVLNADASLMIRNYIEIIRRDIVDEYQLMEICNDIYNKHKKALDLIFENRIDDKNMVGSIIKEVLHELEKEGRILFDEQQKSNTYLMFHTADMDEYLPALEQPNSSFRTNRVYCYNIIVRDKQVYASFELGGFHAADVHKATMKKILSLHKPNEVLEEGFKFKQVLKTKKFDFSNVSELESAIRGVVEGFVDELLIMEAQLLFNLDNLDMYVQLEDNDLFDENLIMEEGDAFYE